MAHRYDQLADTHDEARAKHNIANETAEQLQKKLFKA